MKKIITLFALITLVGCAKEVNNQPTTTAQDCKCGVIFQQDNYTSLNNGTLYIYDKYRVNNNCTGNLSGWIETQVMFTTANSKVGSNYCATFEW